MFSDGWNNHPLSSEHNMTPVQLWVRGLYNTTLHEEDFSEVGFVQYCPPTTIFFFFLLNKACCVKCTMQCLYALNNCRSVDTAQGEAQAYGIDWNGPVPIECEGDEVVVPETFCPLNHHQEQELLRTVSPSAPSNNYGTDLYLATLSLVQQMLCNNIV